MRFSPPPRRPTDSAQTARILDPPMPHRRIPLLLLILVTPLAAAQDRGARVEREANNPLRMIIEASKIKPKAKPAEAVRPVDRPVQAAVPSVAAAASVPAELPRVAVPAGTVESTVATVEVGGEAERATVPAPAAPDPLPSSAAPATVLAPLQLADMVEPVTPRMLLGKLRGEVQVVGNAGQSRINWTATFDVVEGIPSERALAIVDGILQSAAPGLIAKFGAV